MPPTRDGLKAMKRSQLQRLAKQNRLRGNLKTAELVDLLAEHFEQQQKSSERTAGSSAPSPPPSSHLKDAENREPTPIVVQSVPAPTTPMDKLSLPAIGLADIDLTQLSQPNLPTPSRITALETLCTRLISHATSSAATISLLQSRLEAAEQSINNLVTTLDETRTQLGSTQSQLRSLQSSLAASDQIATETAASMATDIDYARQTAEAVGIRLTQAEERWQTGLEHLARQVGEPDDKLLFEPPALPRASSRSRRSKSRETPGPTFAWAQGQQAIANGGLGLPAVRLFGATSSSATIPEELEFDVEAPGTSASSSRPQLAPSALPISVPPSTSWSSSASASYSKKTTSVESHIAQPPESSRTARQTSTSRESSRAAGKRPASPIPIPDNPHAEYDNARASKRPRHASGGQQGESSRATGKRHDDESPSLNSFSAGGSVSTAESPVFPPSPIVEPSTPPSKRPTALLPPIEIISTPSPTTRSQATMAMSMRKEYGDPHGFATAPRPPAEGPASPTLESPRRQMARRFKVELEPPSVLEFPPTSTVVAESARKKQKARERPSTPARGGAAKTPSPLTRLMGKGKVVRASVDPETASAVRSRSASEDADGDVTMTVAAGPSTSVVEERAGSAGPTSKPAAGSGHKRNSSFFGPPTVDFPASGAYSQLELAPPPPPPHSSVSIMSSSSSTRRLGSAPLLMAEKPRPNEKPRDYSADPDDEPSNPSSTARPARMVGRAATHTTLAAPVNLSTVTPSNQRSSWWRR